MGGEIEDRLRGAVAGDSVCSLCEDMWEKYYGAVKHYTEQTFPAQISRFQQTQTHRPAQQKDSTIFAFLHSISYTGVQNSMTMLIFIPFDIQIWEIFKLIEREILFSHGICVNLCKVNSRCQIMTSPRKFKNKSSRMKQIFNISKICKLYRLNKVISEFPLSSSQ